MIGHFRRKHDKKVNLKRFERSTISTLLIPKHLVEKLDLVLSVVLDTKTMKKSYPSPFQMCYRTKGDRWFELGILAYGCLACRNHYRFHGGLREPLALWKFLDLD